MTNLEKYNNIFMSIFSVELEKLNADFTSDQVNGWDSIHQLSIVSNIEEAFDIMLDPEDILGLTSYVAGQKILAKYNVLL